MSAQLCFRCKTRPRWPYGSGRVYSYCHECARQMQKEYARRRYRSYGDGSSGSLHRMADQYRPKDAERSLRPEQSLRLEADTKTADPESERNAHVPEARRPRTTKEKEFK